jgi:hypothetical protein
MGQDEYLEDLAAVRDGEPHARLADPRPDVRDTMEYLRQIGRDIGDPQLQQAIEAGEVTGDDPRVAAFEKGLQAEETRNREALAALEKEAGEDLGNLANAVKKQMVILYEEFLAAKERLTNRSDRTARMIEDGLSLTEPYRREARLEQASYDRAYRAFQDYAAAYGIDADIREALARRDARAAERVKQTGIRRRMRALRALKRLKQRVIKRITRSISFENVAFEQAVIAKTVQRIMTPSIIKGANRWVGSQEGPFLREVWSQWSTDEQFREKLMKDAKIQRATFPPSSINPGTLSPARKRRDLPGFCPNRILSGTSALKNS